MIDIDVIQNDTATTILHWFQPDLIVEAPPTAMPTGAIQSNTQMNLVLDTSKDITGTSSPAGPNGAADYLDPGPPPGPPHRYVQVLFSQPANFSVPPCFSNIMSQPGGGPINVQGRVGFDIAQFIQATGLAKRPIAGNYFRAQNPKPGSLTQNASQMALRNNMCPGVTVAGTTAPATAGMPAGMLPPVPGAKRVRRWA